MSDNVTLKEYVDMRFEANKVAVDAALAAQEKAVAAALAAQREKGSGRQEIWGYVIGASGIIVAIATAILVKGH